MALSADIAQELIDTILDFLHDDHASLLSSSLVARKWVSASRHHVFERITINHFYTGRARHIFRDSAHSFLEIGRSPDCTILSSIRDVVLNVESGPAPILLKELVDVLARAPVSKILFMDHANSLQDPISLSWMPPHFPGLHEFSYNSLDRFVLDIFTLVGSFSQLRSLSLYSNSRDAARTAIMQAKPYPTIPHAVFTYLQTLRLRLFSHQSDEFMAWLQTFGDHIRLETLDIDVFHSYHNGWGPISALNAFLGSNGAYLRDFGLRIHYEDDRDVDETILLFQDSDGDLDLSGLTNLRTLSLGTHNVEALCPALTSLPSDAQSLETFELVFREWIHYDEFPCMCNGQSLVEDFVDAMSQDQFSSLRDFSILVPEFFGDEWMDALRQYFPRWKDTDILRIGFIDRFKFPLDSWESVSEALAGVTTE